MLPLLQTIAKASTAISTTRQSWSQTANARGLSSSLPRITILKNGLKICTTNTPSHASSLGVFINSGTRHDIVPGLSHLLCKSSFTSNAKHTPTTLQNAIESIGGQLSAQAGHEFTQYTASLFKHHIPTTMELLSSMLLTPKFSAEEIEKVCVSVGYEIGNLVEAQVMQERMVSVAYNGKSVGKSVRGEMQGVDVHGNVNALHLFQSMYYTPDEMCVAGVGVEHDYFVEHVDKMFGKMKITGEDVLRYRKSVWENAVYTGGVSIVDTSEKVQKNPDDQVLTHVYVGFEGLGMQDPDIYALAVLSSLLGGGGSFSAGGPGKGMYTRLYKNIMNKHYWVESANNFNHTFSDSGLFGMYCAILPGRETHQAIGHVMCEQLVNTTLKIGEVELSRAKNMLKSMILMSGESQLTQVSDLGRQCLMFGGKSIDEQENCMRIDLVEEKDIQRVARRVIMGSDEVSRFEFNDGIMRPFKRTGPKRPTIAIQGPLIKNDALYQLEDVLKSWGIMDGVSTTKGGSILSKTRNLFK